MTTAMDLAIEKINSYARFILFILLMTSIGGLFNAWHILVSNFYAFVPHHWCKISELQAAGWTPLQVRNVSVMNETEDGSSCYAIGWNYTLFAQLGYDKSLAFIRNSTSYPDKTPCKHFFYDEVVPHSTVVSQWDLVCGKKLAKTNVQGSIAFGKFLGGLFCGFLADMYGRKPVIVWCSVIYFISGVGAALTDTFWVFLVARFCTGIAGAGVYECGFTLLAEFIGKNHRASLGCLFNMGYPIGHITLPGLSLLILNWRHLQLAISLPICVFLFHMWLLPESPRWLIVNGHYEEAWKIIKRFDKNYEEHLADSLHRVDSSFQPAISAVESLIQSVGHIMIPVIPGFSRNVRNAVTSTVPAVIRVRKPSTGSNVSITGKLASDVKKIFLLFSTVELCKRISISIFSFISAALVYYVLALNAENFKLEQHLYTFIAGWVGVPGYIFPLLIMLCTGRKLVNVVLFLAVGLSMTSICLVPKGKKLLILMLAMMGRFTNVAVFGILTVYVAELFPTVVRNSAIGVSLAMSQLGSIYAPYIVDLLGPYGWYLPSTICGIDSLLAAILMLPLPETKGKELTNTVEDVKKQSDNVSLKNCCKIS